MNQQHKRCLLAIIISFLVLRFIFIVNFPLFFDEAIYIHWAQQVMVSWKWAKFISLLDGKQPLFIWLMSLSLRFIKHPVVAGRVISVLAGMGVLMNIYLITKKLFDKKTALFSALLYTIMPFFLVYDGLALMDATLLFFATQTCLFALHLVKKMQFRFAVLLGVTIGLGLLTKSSANFFIIFLPLNFLFFLKSAKPSEKNKLRIFKCLLFTAASILIAKFIESILRLSIYYDVIASKTHDFIKSFDEFFIGPTVGLKDNFLQITEWLIGYFGISFFVLLLIAFILKKKLKEKIYLLLQALIPITMMLFFGKVLYPRYFLFMVWPLVPLVAFSFLNLWQFFIKKQKTGWLILIKKLSLVFIFLILFFNPMKKSFVLLTKAAQTALPEKERWQFFTGEPSGLGIKKLRVFFDQQLNELQGKQTVILVDKSLGILPNGIEIFYLENKNFKFVGSDGVSPELIERYKNKYQPEILYLLLSWQDLPAEIEAAEMLIIEREGETNVDWRVYEIVID